MSVIPYVEFVHRTPRRTRLRLSRCTDRQARQRVEAGLMAYRGVVSVEANPLTGCLIVWHNPSFDWNDVEFPALGLFHRPWNGHDQAQNSPHPDLFSLAIKLISLAFSPRPLVSLLEWLAEEFLEAAVLRLLPPLKAYHV